MPGSRTSITRGSFRYWQRSMGKSSPTRPCLGGGAGGDAGVSTVQLRAGGGPARDHEGSGWHEPRLGRDGLECVHGVSTRLVLFLISVHSHSELVAIESGGRATKGVRPLGRKGGRQWLS